MEKTQQLIDALKSMTEGNSSARAMSTSRSPRQHRYNKRSSSGSSHGASKVGENSTTPRSSHSSYSKKSDNYKPRSRSPIRGRFSSPARSWSPINARFSSPASSRSPIHGRFSSPSRSRSSLWLILLIQSATDEMWHLLLHVLHLSFILVN